MKVYNPWGYPQSSSILVGFSTVNHTFWGLFPHMVGYGGIVMIYGGIPQLFIMDIPYYSTIHIYRLYIMEFRHNYMV